MSLEEGKLYEVSDWFGLNFVGKKHLNSKTVRLKHGDVVMYLGHNNDYEDMLLLAPDGTVVSFEFDSPIDLHQNDIFRRVA